MHRDFYSTIDGVSCVARVLVADVAGAMLMQVGVKRDRENWTGVGFTQPRYLLDTRRTLVLCGIRGTKRMPSWMLADVLQDMHIPEDMCEAVRRADLDRLGEYAVTLDE